MVSKAWVGSSTEVDGRRAIAASLLAVGRALVKWSRAIRRERLRQQAAPVLEFYAEAGAPEGALYVDGRLVGHLPGVNRL